MGLIGRELSDEEREKFLKDWEAAVEKEIANGMKIKPITKDEMDKRTPYQEQVLKKIYNEPAHYHQHDLDTIEFLQRGFPPDVFMAFAIGHIIKYAQRSKYKNGREDLVKMVDYAKRALDWYDKTHS